MKDVVFLIPINADSRITPLRRLLRENMINSLKNQTSGNWEALLIGEYDKTEGNMRYIPAVSLEPGYQKRDRNDFGHTDKHFKIDVAMQYLNKQERKPKYVVRLDDDDLMSPDIVSIIEKSGDKYDCFADEYQFLYNVSNGKICFDSYPWMANTTFHRYEHAKVIIPEFNLTLINCSHDLGFHKYYAGKQVWYSPKMNPLYVRVHSPTVLNLESQGGKISYEDHLKRFGFWHYVRLPEYEPYFAKLTAEYEKLNNVKVEKNFSAFYYYKSLFAYTLYKRFNNFFPRLANKMKKPKP
jgi:hypothetical protein